MSANDLTARINALTREIASGAFPRPAARRTVLDDLTVLLAREAGSREAARVVEAAWRAARG